MGKMMEQGPVLIITFQTQQIMSVRDANGKVVEGDPVCLQQAFEPFDQLLLLSLGENIPRPLRLGAMSRPE